MATPQHPEIMSDNSKITTSRPPRTEHPARPVFPAATGRCAPPIGYIDYLTDKPNNQRARKMLYEIYRLVAPIMFSRGYRIDALIEFYPKDKYYCGELVKDRLFFFPAKSTKIYLRLRDEDDESIFWDLRECVDTMLHELAHIVHFNHRSGFVGLVREHEVEYAEIWGPRTVYAAPDEILGISRLEYFSLKFKDWLNGEWVKKKRVSRDAV